MILFRVLFVSLLFVSSSCFSLSDDQGQTITIESDIAERNEKTGLTQYSGNVIIQQGTLIIDANKVEVFYKDKRVSRILCDGNPASYQQKTKTGGQVIARARIIEYLPQDKIINLKTDASLSRNGTLIKGDSINYDVANETWRAKGDNQSTQKRIQLVIPPLQKTEDSSANTNSYNDLSVPQ
ncbi:MAG: lipopolysaccharide transport periplasmic protein LptA [Porticoccaceae bacterium]|nr:lipopolysaccharide transport periplasmic protein LptA [Porticoccaceae bacterium]